MDNTYKVAKKILWIILFANLMVAALKIAIGTAIHSASMTADGFHSLTDGSSNIIGLLGIWLASRPVDRDHPYGHSKFETLASLFIAGMLLFISGKLIVDAVSNFARPTVPRITVESLIILLLTLLINIFISTFEYRKGKQLKSQILISDSLHTRSDVFISTGVLFTLICIRLGVPAVIDTIASLIVSGFIIYAALEIFKSTSSILVDKAAVDVEKVKEIAMSFEQVEDTHDIRSRGTDQDLYIDMHIATSPDMNVEESHSLIHKIEDKIRNELSENAEVIIHIEPYHDSSGSHSV